MVNRHGRFLVRDVHQTTSVRLRPGLGLGWALGCGSGSTGGDRCCQSGRLVLDQEGGESGGDGDGAGTAEGADRVPDVTSRIRDVSATMIQP